MPGQEIEREIEEEVKKAYIDYAMSVIVSRALPSVEDGLKPVQRRILYTMHLMGLQPNKPTRKSARIVGDCIGKLHPHGDIAVYDALVRMAQDFSLRYPLVQGQGNFGSVDGDPPAAYRYTEARLSQISTEMLIDIEKETVKFIPNFDNSLKEPLVLPAKLPNLLVNGSSGIAVGMTTNIPPHNLGEVADAIVAYIKNPNVTFEKLFSVVKGPDFPTAAYVLKDGLEELYKTGRGHLTLRAKTSIEQVKGGKEKIIINELPYQVNKAQLISDIARLAKERLRDIANIRDESAKGNIRIVVLLRRGANSRLVLNRLYNSTNMQTRFNAIMLALVSGQPKILNLKDMIRLYVENRKEVVRKRTAFDLKRASEREHILAGLMIALKNIDSLISFLKKSKNVTEALTGLVKNFKLSQKQAQAVLDMKLQRLTVLERDKLKKEHEDVKEKIKELKAILASEKAILDIVRKEILELKRKYGDERKTKIIERLPKVTELDLIKKEDIAVILTFKGYIKRMPLRLYQEQKRGGKGVTGAELTTGDFVQHVFTCSTHDNIFFLTERGKLHSLKAHQVPEATRYSKGKAIVNMLNIKDNIKATIPLKDFKGFIVIATKKGTIKKTPLETFKHIRKTGVAAITPKSDDSIIGASLVKEKEGKEGKDKDKEEIVLATKKGIAIRFNSADVREMGRAAYGVIGIRLEKDDEVVGLEIVSEEEKDLSILTVTEKGYGKRSLVSDYRKTKRAGKGIININCSERNGDVVGIQLVTTKDSIIVTTAKGMVIRVPCRDIRVMGRNTQGVKVIRLQKDDKVSDMVKVSVE